MAQDKPYIRVVIFVGGPQEATVGGYRQSAFHPEGTFGSIAEAVEHALTLPVKDPSHPINVLRVEPPA